MFLWHVMRTRKKKTMPMLCNKISLIFDLMWRIEWSYHWINWWIVWHSTEEKSVFSCIQEMNVERSRFCLATNHITILSCVESLKLYNSMFRMAWRVEIAHFIHMNHGVLLLKCVLIAIKNKMWLSLGHTDLLKCLTKNGAFMEK